MFRYFVSGLEPETITDLDRVLINYNGLNLNMSLFREAANKKNSCFLVESPLRPLTPSPSAL